MLLTSNKVVAVTKLADKVVVFTGMVLSLLLIAGNSSSNSYINTGISITNSQASVVVASVLSLLTAVMAMLVLTWLTDKGKLMWSYHLFLVFLKTPSQISNWTQDHQTLSIKSNNNNNNNNKIKK
ncbi:hypothetical protein ACTFIW_002778 [Dictyostelium discoideum]